MNPRLSSSRLLSSHSSHWVLSRCLLQTRNHNKMAAGSSRSDPQMCSWVSTIKMVSLALLGDGWGAFETSGCWMKPPHVIEGKFINKETPTCASPLSNHPECSGGGIVFLPPEETCCQSPPWLLPSSFCSRNKHHNTQHYNRSEKIASDFELFFMLT